MRSFSTCFSLMIFSACLSSMPIDARSDTSKSSSLASSFQGLDFKNRLIQKEFLYQKHSVNSLSDLMEEYTPDSDINDLIQCEETIVLGKPVKSFESLKIQHVIHTAGMTHLEVFYKNPPTKPFLILQSPADQDAFQAEFIALCDVSHIFNVDEWVPFRLRADAEILKCPRPVGYQNIFYTNIKHQAELRLMNQRLESIQASNAR